MKKGFVPLALIHFLMACQPDENCLVAKGSNAQAIEAKQVPSETITGFAWVHTLRLGRGDTLVQEVHFEPEARHYWHAHSEPEVLIGTTGTGYYQEKDKPIQLVQVGDTVRIKPKVMHWHGATSASRFSHTRIYLKTDTVIWTIPVTESQYDGYR
ncbi:hypothetical protein [Siphonobacter sp. SORGH_AS_0500]|uniref:hypothetical protein n=1 Tax=Siphonobacter sp. SORGH_AS_0500 TaxID=1864824 RepID=UPI0028674573|nr:hypothetical protein [Siphonobacter sp. SORGH_AS_0500]MDR6197629.1 quercetin dioxygenase-like cupin family protein [Siphonobacter sp. SORGH_AS_0500]